MQPHSLMLQLHPREGQARRGQEVQISPLEHLVKGVEALIRQPVARRVVKPEIEKGSQYCLGGAGYVGARWSRRCGLGSSKEQ